ARTGHTPSPPRAARRSRRACGRSPAENRQRGREAARRRPRVPDTDAASLVRPRPPDLRRIAYRQIERPQRRDVLRPEVTSDRQQWMRAELPEPILLHLSVLRDLRFGGFGLIERAQAG